jgi:hypothetical protein
MIQHVGLGWWGQHILRQMKGSDIVRILQAVGSREEHRAPAQEYGVDFTTDPSRVLANSSIDLVILATPHAQHAKQIETVATPGCHSAYNIDPRIASSRMLPEHFAPMTGAASPNQVCGADGERDQDGRTARGIGGGGEALPYGGRVEKGRILDELTATTGWHRKHAVRALSTAISNMRRAK